MSTTSIFRATAQETVFPVLQNEITADVVIVGGGITGVTLALNLAERGSSVVLLEARDVGFGATGNSTGNLYVTVSRGIHRLVNRWGSDVARAIIAARHAALEQIDKRVGLFDIPCGFRRCRLHRYATSDEGQAFVENEYQGSLKAGLPVHLEKALPASTLSTRPPHGPIMVLDNQAQFHPQAYVRGLGRVAAKQGCRIFENSMVLEVDTKKHVVRTAEGKVTAKEIVLATHSPKGFHLVHAEMVVNREYGISTRIARDSFPPGIFWGIGDDRLSVRTLDADDGTFLICVGEEHKTGHHDADRSLKSLEASARAQFDIQDVSFRWSAQNYSAADGLPYIGRDATGCFIATGFETDGLVYGTLAATLITDQLGGSDNEFTPIFRAGRFSPVKGAKGLAEETGSVLKALIKDYITAGKPTALSNLAPGKGEIVEVENESLAAYKDPDGTVFAVSPVCTHMKCKVRWNGVENSWDCPCHGSRFAPDGTVLEGPAIEPLQRKLL